MEWVLCRQRLTLWAVAAVMALAPAVTGSARPGSSSVQSVDVVSWLRDTGGFSADDIQRIERGEVIVKGLAGDDETVAIAAAMYLAVVPEFFVEHFRRIEAFKQTPEVLQIGRFGAVPSAADLGALTLDTGELRDARHCKVGDCAFKLDTAGIEGLRSTQDDRAALDALRTHLAGYAAAYLGRGNAALMEYRDRSRPLAAAGELHQILAASPYIERHWPELHAVIGRFSGSLPAGLEHFIYWSTEKVASRPVVSLTHVIIQPPRDGVTVIATKQLYSSHYTTGSLGMTFLQDRNGGGTPRTLVAYINRTRVDVFGGLLGGVKRPLVRSRARAGAERMMKAVKAKLEQKFRGSGDDVFGR